MRLKRTLLESLILPAIILRLVFSSLFFHPDIKKINYQVQFFKQGVVDVYRHIAANSKTLPNTDTFNYPPLTYFAFGSWQAVSSLLLGPALDSWLNDWGPVGYTHPRMFEFMLVLKFPFLIMDLLLAFLLLGIGCKLKTDTDLLLGLWFFNPVSLYAVYMLSSFDLLPVLLTVMSLMFIQKKHLLPAALLLGLGAAVKSYPLLLLPFVLIRASSPKLFAQALALALLGLFIFMLPVLNSPAFRYTMSHSNLMQGIFYATLPISASQSIPLFVLVLGLVFWLSWQRRTDFNLVPEFLTLTLAVPLLSHFHGQWLLWSLPFVLLALSQKIKLWPVTLTAAIGYFGTTWLIPDQFLTFGLFSAINPHALLIPSLYDLIKPFSQPEFFQSLFHTLLAASGIWIIITAWKSYEKE